MDFEWVVVVLLMQLFSVAEVEQKHSSSITYNIPCEMNQSCSAFLEVKSTEQHLPKLLAVPIEC